MNNIWKYIKLKLYPWFINKGWIIINLLAFILLLLFTKNIVVFVWNIWLFTLAVLVILKMSKQNRE